MEENTDYSRQGGELLWRNTKLVYTDAGECQSEVTFADYIPLTEIYNKVPKSHR